MRISIIGHSGSGKTTLAKRISDELSIPHIHLDRFWFEAGGADIVKSTPIEEKERVRKYILDNVLTAIAPDSWVSDGFFSRVQPTIASRADIILYLDTPLWRRLLNHTTRVISPTDRHTELSAWAEFIFFFEIIRRNYAFEPKFQKFRSQYQDKIIILKSRKEINDYVESLKNSTD